MNYSIFTMKCKEIEVRTKKNTRKMHKVKNPYQFSIVYIVQNKNNRAKKSHIYQIDIHDSLKILSVYYWSIRNKPIIH